MSLGQAAECNAKLQAMQWPPEELASLQASVIASVNRAPVSKTQGAVRRGLQNYVHHLAYFTETQWGVLCSSRDPQLKMDTILNHMAGLGLRTPSEPTYQSLTALFLWASEEAVALEQMYPSAKHETLKAIKSQFKRMLVRVSDAAEHVEQLPTIPADLQRTSPTLFASVFSTEQPAAARVLAMSIAKLMITIPMRSTCRDTSKITNLTLPDRLGAQACDFAASMMGQMQQMYQAQQLTLQALQGMQPHAMAPAGPLQLQLPAGLRRVSSQLNMTGSPTLPPQLAIEHDRQAEPPHDDEHAASESASSLQVSPGSRRPVKRNVADATLIMLSSLAARKSAKDDAKLETKGGVPQPKGKAKAKAKSCPKAKAKSCPKAAAKAPAKGAANSKPEGHPPHWAWERTRSQIMGRTGLKGPGQSKRFAYASKATMVSAEAAATKWVGEQKKLRGYV